MSSKNDAIIRALLSFPGLRGKDMRWFRHRIYQAVQLLEAGANTWDISPAHLVAKTETSKGKAGRLTL